MNEWGSEWLEHLQGCKVKRELEMQSKMLLQCTPPSLQPQTSPAHTYSAFSGRRWHQGTRAFSRKPMWLCYLQIVRSCRSWQFWRCQKPPGWGLLVEAAFPAHPKIHSHLVIGESDADTDSSALDRCCHKTLPLTHRFSPILSPTHLTPPMLMSRFTQGFQKRNKCLSSLIAGTSVRTSPRKATFS